MDQKEITKEEDLNLDRLFVTLIRKAYRRYPYLTDEEIAAVIGCTERTLYRMINTHEIDKEKERGRINKTTREMIGKLRLMGYKVVKMEQV